MNFVKDLHIMHMSKTGKLLYVKPAAAKYRPQCSIPQDLYTNSIHIWFKIFKILYNSFIGTSFDILRRKKKRLDLVLVGIASIFGSSFSIYMLIWQSSGGGRHHHKTAGYNSEVAVHTLVLSKTEVMGELDKWK